MTSPLKGAALACAVLLLSSPALARAKTDIVTLVNGDRVTCEIKSLKRAILVAKTDSMGSLDIEWDDVVELSSQYYFRVVMKDSKRHYGSLELTGPELKISGDDQSLTLDKRLVVEITPIERSLLSKFSGSLSLGASYTKASNIGQGSFDWRNAIQTERSLTDLELKAIATSAGSDAEEDTVKADLTGAYNLLLRRKLFGTVSAGVHRHDELGIDRRFLVGLSVGGKTIQTNHNSLTFSVGFARNGEVAQGTDENQVSVEATIGGKYAFFKYNTPKADISVELDVFPSLTESGRYRVEFDLVFRREIVKDLTFDVTYFTSYDSDPVDVEGSKNDYAATVAVGWTY